MTITSYVNNQSVLSLIHNVNVVQDVDVEISRKILDVLKADPSLRNKKKLIQDFKVIGVDQLNVVLDEYIEFITQSVDKVDPLKAIHELVKIIPLKKIEDIIRVKYPDHRNALRKAKSMLGDAKYYLENTSNNLSTSLKTKISAIVDALIACLESFIIAFGIADFFKAPESDMQANTKAQRIFMLISVFSGLSAALIPLLGAAVAGPIIGGAILFFAVISLVYPYIKPFPSFINNAINLNKQIQEKKLCVMNVGKHDLDKIALAIIAGKKLKAHPMLIGKSGVGKTETVKAFAKAIENGDYPELKNKRVFYINSADLLAGTQREGNKELNRISEAIGRHRHNIILVFDEIHILCQKKNNAIGEQLKSYLDDFQKGFPHVIGITTQEEFYKDIYKNNQAFARRFKQINIDNPSNAHVKTILNKTVLQRAPKTLVEPGVLEYLQTQTNEAFENCIQPATSIKILSQCIKRTSETQRSPIEEKIDNVHKKIDALISDKAIIPGLGFQSAVGNQEDVMRDLEDNLAGLEQEFITYQDNIAQLNATRDTLVKVKTKVFENVNKIAKYSINPSKKEKVLIKEFLLQSHFLVSGMEKHIRAQALNLEVKAVIDESLVDEMIEDELDNQLKVKEAVENGKEGLDARENEASVA